MKGVVLAGGAGTRLMPLTKVVHKHLLPIGDKPMVWYAINKLVSLGIKDIIVVINDEGYVRVLKDGKEWWQDVTITYVFQDKPHGIAQAVYLVKGFIPGGERFVVHLADNILMDPLDGFLDGHQGCKIILKEVADPRAYGVATMDKNGNIVSLEEKPEHPKSKYAVTGIYLFDKRFFKFFKKIKKSARGEYEIVDIIRQYMNSYSLKKHIAKGDWYDCGKSIKSYLEISAKFAGDGNE